MTSFVVLILTIALLVMLSGYLSVGEAAISSVSAAKAQTFGEDNPKMAPLVDWELAERQKVIIAILVAHNLFSVAASSFATVLTTNVWGEKGVFWATVIMTVLMVLLPISCPNASAWPSVKEISMSSCPACARFPLSLGLLFGFLRK